MEILGLGTRLVVISQTCVSQRVQMNRHDPLIGGAITSRARSATQDDVTGILSVVDNFLIGGMLSVLQREALYVCLLLY